MPVKVDSLLQFSSKFQIVFLKIYGWHLKFGFLGTIWREISPLLERTLKNILGELIRIGFMAYAELQHFCDPFKARFFHISKAVIQFKPMVFQKLLFVKIDNNSSTSFFLANLFMYLLRFSVFLSLIFFMTAKLICCNFCNLYRTFIMKKWEKIMISKCKTFLQQLTKVSNQKP